MECRVRVRVRARVGAAERGLGLLALGVDDPTIGPVARPAHHDAVLHLLGGVKQRIVPAGAFRAVSKSVST